MSKRIISIITNGLPWGIFFFCLSWMVGTVPFRLSNKDALNVASVTGLLAILFNGLLYRRFRISEEAIAKNTTDLAEAKPFLFACPAGFRVDDELILGKLSFTTEELVFQKMTDGEDKTELTTWKLSELSEYRFYPSLWNPGAVFRFRDREGALNYFEVSRIKPFRRAFQRGWHNGEAEK